ncbi:T9SS type A sorting domain-containing protein [uncultured Parabacteroides sp.]|uniref:T9SS type A sorting domain-containing protein n=3 Tax=uncultured Parabacteroides sp. TaxID=512312 RepID=UPI0026580601|nr:T9SS type A sorting domain-containing protein [uncultured Parabacteroides sp.]
MKRNKIRYDRWLRTLFLSFALLTGGGGWMVWGQETETNRPTINLKYTDTHDSVFVDTKEIYVVPGRPRELFIQELRISISDSKNNSNETNDRYNWYVHWYVKNETLTTNTKGEISFLQFKTTQNEANNQGGEFTLEKNTEYITSNQFVTVTSSAENRNDGGLVWSKRLKDQLEPVKGYGMDASTIQYTAPKDYQGGDVVYCDVSIYQDGAINESVYTEPTLTKRVKYIIKNADECIQNIKEKKVETFEYYFPAVRKAKNSNGRVDQINKSINFHMPSLPNNYFWKDENNNIHQGKEFQFKVGENETYQSFSLVTRNNNKVPFQQTQRIPEKFFTDNKEDIIIYVQAIDENQNSSGDLAKFTFHPLQDVGFELEENIKNDINHYPRRQTDKYELLASVNFDQGEPVLTSNLNVENNIAKEPFSAFKDNYTTYGFWDPDIYPLQRIGWNKEKEAYFATSNQNIYALFRSANHSNVSVTGVNKEYKTQTVNGETKKWNYEYLWISGNNTLYDRTYEISMDLNEPDNKGKTQEELKQRAKHGHFYYIDASNEFGTVVKVPIEEPICPNTEITVTAWLADMTRVGLSNSKDPVYPLAPNLNIIFKGVDNSGNGIPLHSLTTGDALVHYKDTKNSDIMKWQQLYYTFVLESNVQYERYYLEIQNNEPHTDGADYAIDDIRIFKTKPQVRLVQAGDLCDTEINTVRFVTDYNRALQVLGLKQEQVVPENRRVSYSELPELLKEYLTEKYPTKQDDALQYFTSIYYAVYDENEKNTPVQINYNNSKADKQNYRISYISTRLEDMEWTKTFTYDKDDPNPLIASAPVFLNGELIAGNKYVARLFTDISVMESEPSIENNPCALVGDPFELIVAGNMYEIVKGESEVILPENAQINETYTINGKFWYKENVNSESFKELKNATFDWFFGTLEEFIAPNTIVVNNGGSYSIQTALNTYNASNTTEAIKNEIKSVLETNYGIKSTDNPSGRLILKETQFTHRMTQKYQPVVVQVSADQEPLSSLGDNVLYCSKPVQFDLGGVPPTIDPGDPDTPDPDPEDPKDPDPKDPNNPNQPDDWNGKHVRSVRVMLTQIQDMLSPTEENKKGTLRIPIHFRKSAKGEIFAVNPNNNKIKVVRTSDPNWQNNDKEVATLTELADQYIDLESTDNNTPKWNTHYFKIKFNTNNGFREGFWYMVDIPYQVVDNEQKVYEGSMKLTLKIVPEYVTWVGSVDGMHNWNNDGPSHWRRSKDDELYTTSVASANGTHDEAYTPMRFTKVTIYGNKENKPYSAYPHLYELNKQSQSPILDMVTTDETIGAATKNIEYDLLADPDYEKVLWGEEPTGELALGEHDYACVRFYGNTCDEIYIKPESEILHTEYLTYNKAHVDYEMAPNRWYMLASPLKGVVSGDMYLPTETSNVGKYARQETPAFGVINYDNTNYTRWQPAVYMRGWDKASAIVVRPGIGSNNQVDYGIKGSWSNLYNNVDVPFTPGTGFSIGTKANETTLGKGNKVLFRLPKADDRYIYYGSTTGSGDETTLTNRAGNGRFHISPDEKGQDAVISCSASSTGGMFGNPFMSHLDMTKFLQGKSQNTYYIMTATGTTTNILGDKYSISTGDADPNFVAPLQSFIVPDLLSATFNTDMIAKAPANGTNVGLRSATVAPAEEPLPQLRITATRNGVRNTAVVAGLATASDSYVEGEDAALLINEEVAAPQVYTLAGNQMVAINVTPDLAEIPVGIHGKDATPVELSFKLSGAMKNVKLVDKQTGKRYDVTDGLTLTVSGNTYGRYFLNGSIATSNEIIARNHIIFYNSAPGRIDVSSVDALSEVTVYDISGRALRTLRNLNTPTASVDHLAPGIYVVRAESDSQVVSEKVEVK